MRAENSQTQAYPLPIRLLIACGALGPILFILVFLVEGAIRPGYSAWHNFVSDLSLSNQGWMQIANFLLCGVLMLCFALGLRQVFRTGRGSVWGPLLLGICGLSLLIAGFFVTDPSLGYYPPGTSSSTHTLHGTIHGANAPLAFGSLTMAIFVLARRFASDRQWRGWAPSSLAWPWRSSINMASSLIRRLACSNASPSSSVGAGSRSWQSVSCARCGRPVPSARSTKGTEVRTGS